MMEQPLVSIILPTYNVVKYLEQCLDSINNQTYSNYEVIIVVDGATDGSYELALEYCNRHKSFRTIWQENSGSGPARNTGIANANGDFCFFIDPDDWIESDCLERMVEAQSIGDYDLTISQKIERVFDDNDRLISTKKTKPYSFEYIGMQRCREHYLQIFDYGLLGAPTRKLYRTIIIKDNSIEFPSYRRSQDIVFNYRYFNYINSVASVDYNGYNYRMSLKNNIGKCRKEYYQTIANIYRDIIELHEQWQVNMPKKQLATHLYCANLYGYLLMSAHGRIDINESLSHPLINEILNFSEPVILYQRVVRKLLLNGQVRLAEIFLRLIYYVKTKLNR